MKTTLNSNILLGVTLLASGLLGGIIQAAPLATAFTYQGTLSSGGNAANGSYDFRFGLFDALTSGSQVGSSLTNAATGVTNGSFTVTLGFGSVFDGNARWLEIGVRTNGGGPFATLSPRQQLTPSAYALYAPNAAAAATALGAASANSVAAANVSGTMALAQLPTAVLTNNRTGVTLGGTFNRNGAGLTSLNATQVASGTLADARLSANVALLSAHQTFTGTNAFSSKVAIGKTTPATALDVNGTVLATAFVGNAAALTNLNGAAIQNATIGTAQLAAGAVTNVNIASNTITAANFAPGVGLLPPDTLVLSATVSNSALLAAGFAPQLSGILGQDWTCATNAAPWTGRDSFGLVSFNNQMWVLGGYFRAGPDVANDVWSSSNGVAWTQVMGAAPWRARYGHGALAFNNQMWVLGGYSIDVGVLHDIWSSSNGTTWTQVTNAAPWSARTSHAALVFNGQMWVLGGWGAGAYLHDVWSSSNGVTWTQVTNAAPWSGRIDCGAVSFNNQIWVMGGWDGLNSFRDVWSSSNGLAWTQVTSAAPWSVRAGFGAVASNGQMWVLGGYGDDAFNDVWSSSDGITWTQVTSAAPWHTRGNLAAVAHNNLFWVMGGYDNGAFNDVWFTQPTSTNMLGSFYLYEKQ